MPTFVWAGGVLILACAVFVIWRLVQLTRQPRRYFRAGYADPERKRFTPADRGTRTPETVREPLEPGVLDTTLDGEAARLIQGPRHDAPPITSDIDRETGHLLDEELGGPVTAESTDQHTHYDEKDARTRRRMAAAEHHWAAEEHRRAAAALNRDDEVTPAERPADGPQQTRRGGISPS